jgi:hypothetical protein
MSSYVEHKTFHFTPSQKLKMRKVLDGKIDFAKVRLGHKDLESGSDTLSILERDYKRLMKAIAKGSGFELTITQLQMQHNMKGGFLGALLGQLLMPAITSTIGHLTGNGVQDGDGLRGKGLKGFGVGQKVSDVLTANEKRQLKMAVEKMMDPELAGSGIGDDIKQFFTGFIRGFTDPIGSIKALIGSGDSAEPMKAIRPSKYASKKMLEGTGLTFY